MPIYDNYTRDDSGLGPNGKNVGIAQENVRQDINGSSDKPFPQERNWVQNNDPMTNGAEGIVVPQMATGMVHNQFGQVKYAKREGAISIYKDKTRNTANDNAASAKAESSTVYEVEGENEESQGI